MAIIQQQSSNPAFSDKVYKGLDFSSSGSLMTVQGTVNKSFLLIVLLVVSAAYSWGNYYEGTSMMGYMIAGGIGGFIVAMITVFKVKWSPITAPIYAALEGLFLGGLSAIMDAMYPGIVIQAIALTFGTLFGMLFLYKSGIIKVTQKFRSGLLAATGGIFFVYMLTWILGFFGINMPFIHEGGLLGIGFSLFVVVIAALNLILDFDFIHKSAGMGAPKYMEWYGAFGLMVTLVWLYIEFLRLLSKLNRE